MPQPRLLLIDDEPALAEYLANAARASGFDPIVTERDNRLRDSSKSMSIVPWKSVFDGIPKAFTVRHEKAKRLMSPESRSRTSLQIGRISFYGATRTIQRKQPGELLICCRKDTSYHRVFPEAASSSR